MTKHVLEFEDVWKTYSMGDAEVNALAGLNLALKEGSFTAVMGPSGSGKSTFLHVSGILDTPTRGLFRINGRQTSELSLKEQALLRRNEIGFVFQRFNLLSQLSALENVMLLMINKDSEKAIGVLDKMGLEDKYHKRPTQLSGGEQQRVAISRALINDPSLILADEPTGSLDSKTGDVILKLLSDLHEKENVTLVMVTHEPYVGNMAERIVNVLDGKIQN